jgi:hypothetical protein
MSLVAVVVPVASVVDGAQEEPGQYFIETASPDTVVPVAMSEVPCVAVVPAEKLSWGGIFMVTVFDGPHIP